MVILWNDVSTMARSQLLRFLLLLLQCQRWRPSRRPSVLLLFKLQFRARFYSCRQRDVRSNRLSRDLAFTTACSAAAAVAAIATTTTAPVSASFRQASPRWRLGNVETSNKLFKNIFTTKRLQHWCGHRVKCRPFLCPQNVWQQSEWLRTDHRLLYTQRCLTHCSWVSPILRHVKKSFFCSCVHLFFAVTWGKHM